MHISSNDLRPGEEPSEGFSTIISTPRHTRLPYTTILNHQLYRDYTTHHRPCLRERTVPSLQSAPTIHHHTYIPYSRVFKFHHYVGGVSIRRRTSHLPKSLHLPDPTEGTQATMADQVEYISSPSPSSYTRTVSGSSMMTMHTPLSLHNNRGFSPRLQTSSLLLLRPPPPYSDPG